MTTCCWAEDIILVRGGGDLATGAVQKLWRAGFRVAIAEVARPTAIRRTVALCEAVYGGVARVEDMTARLATGPDACKAIWDAGEIPVLVDPDASSLSALRPVGLVDAILAKRNLGTHAAMAPVVIALGPGFAAPTDAHAVIETKRGHTLGRVILDGPAAPNTGRPGEIAGQSDLRVLRAPCEGFITHHRKIGDAVRQGEGIFSVGGQPVRAPFDGLLRGLLREGLPVAPGMKAADVDPRLDSDWHTLSDKARCIGGGVLEAYMMLRRKVRT